MGRLLEGTPFGRPFEAAVDPFFEHLKEFIHGFERMAQGGSQLHHQPLFGAVSRPGGRGVENAYPECRMHVV